MSFSGFSPQFLKTMLEQGALWKNPLKDICSKAGSFKVKTFMYTPTEGEYIEASASINDVIHRLIIGEHHSLLVTKGPDILGVVRLTDVFELIHLRLKALHLAARIGGKENSDDA